MKGAEREREEIAGVDEGGRNSRGRGRQGRGGRECERGKEELEEEMQKSRKRYKRR